MNDNRLQQSLPRARKHLAHLASRNARPCPCDLCTLKRRDRFEFRVTVALLFVVGAVVGFGAVLLGAWP